jgi:hypothetical protein
MSSPWLSVIGPVYNGENDFRQALESIAIQDIDGIVECAVIEGNSADGSLAILDRVRDCVPLRIEQMGRSSSWIDKTYHALSLAKGEYACFLHHHDLWLSGRVSMMKRLVRQFPEEEFLLHPSYFWDACGRRLSVRNCPLPACSFLVELEQKSPDRSHEIFSQERWA